MRRPALLALLIGSLCTSAAATQLRWFCASPRTVAGSSASNVQENSRHVAGKLLPSVVFVGETKPETIQARMLKHKTPAVSIAVIENGKLHWSAAWGQLQADGDRAKCDSLFQAGSIAKPVTVLAALRMRQEGKIDLDVPIDTYLKSYHLPAGKQTEANPVTLRNLFAHTSGITPGGYDGYAQGQRIPSDAQTALAETPSNSRKLEVLATPGEALAYSGGGYTVAEIALQDHLGAPFEQLMYDWLLNPVGSFQADFSVPLPDASHAIAARGHRGDGSVVLGGWHNHPEQAAAGLWATASDLATLLVEVGKGYRGESKLFDQASIRELLATPFDGHSYGFRLIGEGDQQFITHYGGTTGYRAAMTMNVHSGDGAVFLSNGEGGQELGREFFAAVSRFYGWPAFREVQVTRTTQPVKVLNSLTGDYLFPDDGPTVSVVYEHKALTLVFPNGDRYAMIPIEGAPREFIHADTGVRASFEGDEKNLSMQLYGQTAKRTVSDD